MRRFTLVLVAALALVATPALLLGSAEADGRSHGDRRLGHGQPGNHHFGFQRPGSHHFSRHHGHGSFHPHFSRHVGPGGFHPHGRVVHPGYHVQAPYVVAPVWVRTPGQWIWDGWSWVWVTGYWAR